MKTKGMRDIHTAQNLINRSLKATRAQNVAQLARMEHEKARLEREINLWVGKQQETERHLQQVRQHIEQLQRALENSSADHETPSANDGVEARAWQVIPLEY